MNHVSVIHCPDSSNLWSPISNSLLRGFTPPASLQHKELSVRPGRHPRSRRRQVAIPTGYVCGGWEAECWSNQRQVKTKARRYFSSVGFQLLNVWVKCFGGEERHRKGRGIRKAAFVRPRRLLSLQPGHVGVLTHLMWGCVQFHLFLRCKNKFYFLSSTRFIARRVFKYMQAFVCAGILFPFSQKKGGKKTFHAPSLYSLSLKLSVAHWTLKI